MPAHAMRIFAGSCPGKAGPSLRISRGTRRQNPTTAAFTLAELIIGFGLSMMIMAAVLSSYVFIARAYTKVVGFSEPNQPAFEAQGRRTLDVFAADAQVALGVLTPPSATYPLSASEFTLVVPRATGGTKNTTRSYGGTKNVTYYYNSGAAMNLVRTINAVAITVPVPAKSLVRIDWSEYTASKPLNVLTVLHTTLTSCAFAFYDTFVDIDDTRTTRPYTTYVNYLNGISQVSLALSAQSLSRSGTDAISREYLVRSPRYVMRNKALLY
jgi:hypothetical protein